MTMAAIVMMTAKSFRRKLACIIYIIQKQKNNAFVEHLPAIGFYSEDIVIITEKMS